MIRTTYVSAGNTCRAASDWQSGAVCKCKSQPHERLTKAGIEDIVRRIGRRAGVEKAHPHRFRRTAITNALNRGMPLQEAVWFAGHVKPETTLRYSTEDQEAVQYHHKKYLSA